MDHTPMDDLISELEAADPAAAPDIAGAIADGLSEELEATDGEASAASA